MVPGGRGPRGIAPVARCEPAESSLLPPTRSHRSCGKLLGGVGRLKRIVAIYIRLPLEEIERLRDTPDVLPKYDPRVALADGRGLDLGRAWEELGCFLDGGVSIPEHGPTVGEEPMPDVDPRAAWSYVRPERVRAIANALADMKKADFRTAYKLDPEETADHLPSEHTGAWGDRATIMFKKLRQLASHYREAADRGQAMLVRIGERLTTLKGSSRR